MSPKTPKIGHFAPPKSQIFAPFPFSPAKPSFTPDWREDFDPSRKREIPPNPGFFDRSPKRSQKNPKKVKIAKKAIFAFLAKMGL